MPETIEQVEAEAADHPVWSCGNEAIKREFRRLEADRDKWVRWHCHADSDAEHLQSALEVIAASDDPVLAPQYARLAVDASGKRGRQFVKREEERDA